MGFAPASLDPDIGDAALARADRTGKLHLGDGPEVAFNASRDINLGAIHAPCRCIRTPYGFVAFGRAEELVSEIYYSVGGGFVATEAELLANAPGQEIEVPFSFASAEEIACCWGSGRLEHRRHDARQRVRQANRRGSRGRARRHPSRHERLYGSRHDEGRRLARRPEGAPPRPVRCS